MCQALEQLSDSDASIFPQDGVPAAIRSLLEVGDELIDARDSSDLWGIITNKERITYLVFLLLRRLNEPQRLEVLKESAETGKALSTIVEIISSLGDQHGKYSGRPSPEEERLIGLTELSVLESVAAARIIKTAESGNIMSTPEFLQVIYRWKEWGDKGHFSDWLHRYLADDANFLLFLKQLIPDNVINSDESAIDLKRRGYLRIIQDFIDIAEYPSRIDSIRCRDELTDKDRIRLDLFLLHETIEQSM